MVQTWRLCDDNPGFRCARDGDRIANHMRLRQHPGTGHATVGVSAILLVAWLLAHTLAVARVRHRNMVLAGNW